MKRSYVKAVAELLEEIDAIVKIADEDNSVGCHAILSKTQRIRSILLTS